jgi:hypothetical protein
MKHLRRTATLLATLTASLLGLSLAAPSAFATRLLEQDGPSTPASPATVPHGGVAGWEIALIAVGTVLAAVAVTAMVRRVRPRPALHPTAR